MDRGFVCARQAASVARGGFRQSIRISSCHRPLQNRALMQEHESWFSLRPQRSRPTLLRRPTRRLSARYAHRNLFNQRRTGCGFRSSPPDGGGPLFQRNYSLIPLIGSCPANGAPAARVWLRGAPVGTGVNTGGGWPTLSPSPPIDKRIPENVTTWNPSRKSLLGNPRVVT